jgi:23S rRNA (adenine1618-N6)-methyltransferase
MAESGGFLPTDKSPAFPSLPMPPHQTSALTQSALHPRNRHQGRYDFAALAACEPELRAFLKESPDRTPTIDFSDPSAVRLLNRALLSHQYGVKKWWLPEGFLCPPIPGRADYLHGLADVLAAPDGQIPRGPGVRVLDIGVGASCIYPLLGHAEFGWHFAGSDIEPAALTNAAEVLRANGLEHAITLRHQLERGRIFDGVVKAGEQFTASMCNPPFHASAAEAARASQRKRRNLGQADAARSGAGGPALNFGGQTNELWCTGGEASFVRRMIRESREIAGQVQWFSCLISRSEHLTDIGRQLKKLGAKAVRTVPMAQGNKQSRFVAWSFLNAATRTAGHHAEAERGHEQGRSPGRAAEPGPCW